MIASYRLTIIINLMCIAISLSILMFFQRVNGYL